MPSPNLFIIHTDQQSCWTLGAYGGTVVDTPNIDRIGREGAICTNFFTNSAVCTPSRGCFVTGRYPHAHGAYTNNIPLNRDEITFAHILKDNGYETGYAGKWHLDGPPRPGWVHPDRSMGFDDAEFMFNRGHWKKIEDSPMNDVQPTIYPYQVIGDEDTYTTDWLTTKTIEFLERPRERPFCYMVSLPDPHGPVWVRPPYDTMFHPGDMTLPPTPDLADLPDWAQAAQDNGFGLSRPDREEKLRKFLALYYGEVKLIDDCVGRMLDCLEAQGVLDNTVVVFTADHGEYAGEHGLHGKNNLYETAYRIPMLIRWPERIPAESVVDSVMSAVDFQPTVLRLMGAEPCGREQGKDGSALLSGAGDGEWPDVAQIHHSSLNRAGIFTKDFELAYVRDGDPVLFDRLNDPGQLRNVFADPAHRDTVRALTHEIVEHHTDCGSPAAEWLRATL